MTVSAKILVLSMFVSTVHCFSVPISQSRRMVPLYAEGGTDWIKDAMGQPKEPQFTQTEIDNMENLIVSLSKESNDEKRREKLSSLLEKELKSPSEGDTSPVPDLEPQIPRFARLFQISLDNVGERVQTAARAKAMEKQDDEAEANNEDRDENEIVERLKSEEELQLWALIDMMVQSKTAVKMHMGSLGSKGSFR